MNKKSLVVLFDANPLVNGNKSGVGYYTFNLIQSLARAYPDDIKLVGHYFNFLGSKSGVELPTAPNISYRQSRIIPGKLISITRRLGFQPPLELFFRCRGDINLSTNYVSLPSLTRIPSVVAVHDLSFIDTPDYVSKKNRDFLLKFVPRAVKAAVLVITISEFTKASIIKHYRVPEEKIIITPIPPIRHKADEPQDLKRLGIDGKFMLFVSTIEPRKNILNLVKAYEQLPPETKETYALVLAGGTGWYMEDTLAYIDRLKAGSNRIILTGYVSDDEKTALYEGAELFVMPSHYEGFGMPVLEAMAYGLPTAISDIPVFREVAGESSLYFDKDSPASIANALQKLLNDPALRATLKKQGIETARQYSWDAVASSVYERLRHIAR